MRVLINALLAGSRTGGLGHYIISLAERLKHFTLELALLTNQPELVVDHKIVVVPNNLFPQKGKRGNQLLYLWIQTGLRNIIAQMKLHVLLSPNHEIVFKSSLPQIVIIHDFLSFVALFIEPRQYPLLRKYYRAVLPWGLKTSVVKIISASNATKRDLIRYYGISESKITTVYSGADLPLALEDLSQALSRQCLLYVGRIMPHKNISGVIIASAVAVSDIPVLREIVGDAGVFFSPRDPAKATLQVIEDDQLREDLVNKEHQRHRFFSWDKAAEENFPIFQAAGGRT